VSAQTAVRKDPSDDQLIQRALDGETQAFQLLVDRYLVRIHRYVSRLIGPTWAEDLTQEVFLRAYERRETFRRSSGTFGGWIYGIARNLSIDYLRRKRPVVSMELLRNDEQTRGPAFEDRREPEPSRKLVTEETNQAVERAIRELPEPYKTTFVLCVQEGFSYEQAAAVEGCPVKTISSRLARGRARLRHQMAAYASGLETE